MNVTSTELTIDLNKLVNCINVADIENYVCKEMSNSGYFYTEFEFDTQFRFKVQELVQFFKSQGYKVMKIDLNGACHEL